MTSTSPRHLPVLVTPGPAGYALLDSGEGRKLERFGEILVDRPEPQAMWPRAAPARWAEANAVFSGGGEDDEKGRWRMNKPVPEAWPLAIEDVTMLCRLGGNWHLGLFPEQLPHWQWMRDAIRPGAVERLRVLNLFAYTGAATLIAARAGADVTHVDASKKAVAWARENQAASALDKAPIRWIVDDARKFVAREVRRQKVYDLILVDPPKFGRGPDNEVWELFEHLPAFIQDLAKLLAPGPSRLVLTAYAIRASSLALDGLMRATFPAAAGDIVSGELALVEAGGGRLLPTSLYSRFEGRSRP